MTFAENKQNIGGDEIIKLFRTNKHEYFFTKIARFNEDEFKCMYDQILNCVNPESKKTIDTFLNDIKRFKTDLLKYIKDEDYSVNAFQDFIDRRKYLLKQYTEIRESYGESCNGLFDWKKFMDNVRIECADYQYLADDGECIERFEMDGTKKIIKLGREPSTYSKPTGYFANPKYKSLSEYLENDPEPYNRASAYKHTLRKNENRGNQDPSNLVYLPEDIGESDF